MTATETAFPPIEMIRRDSTLWDRFFERTGTSFRTKDVIDVLDLRNTPYDPDDMRFVGDFRVEGGGTLRLRAHFMPTWDSVEECSIEVLRYN